MGNLVGYGSLVNVEKAFTNGGVDYLEEIPASEPVVLAPVEEKEFLTFDDLAKKEPPRYLPIEHLQIEQKQVNMIYGASGTYKSFLTLDIALQLAIKGKNIVYVAGEGGYGYIPRYLVWKDYHGIETELPNAIIEISAVQLMNTNEVNAFIERFSSHKPELVIFDTVNSCAPGVDENAAGNIAAIFFNCNRIREAFDCTVILVHHTGKANNGPRGSSAWLAGVNTAIETRLVEADRYVDVYCTKQKNGTPFNAIRFSPRLACTKEDRMIDMLSSIILTPVERTATKDNASYSSKEIEVLSILFENKDGLAKGDIMGNVSFAKGSFHFIVSELRKKGCIETIGERPMIYKLTEHGIWECERQGIED